MSMPIDGLDAGRDEKGAVGRYGSSPFSFDGTIDQVVMELGDPGE
jgi:hypothetical protein